MLSLFLNTTVLPPASAGFGLNDRLPFCPVMAIVMAPLVDGELGDDPPQREAPIPRTNIPIVKSTCFRMFLLLLLFPTSTRGHDSSARCEPAGSKRHSSILTAGARQISPNPLGPDPALTQNE